MATVRGDPTLVEKNVPHSGRYLQGGSGKARGCDAHFREQERRKLAGVVIDTSRHLRPPASFWALSSAKCCRSK